jgi:hypothetical protein
LCISFSKIGGNMKTQKILLALSLFFSSVAFAHGNPGMRDTNYGDSATMHRDAVSTMDAEYPDGDTSPRKHHKMQRGTMGRNSATDRDNNGTYNNKGTTPGSSETNDRDTY